MPCIRVCQYTDDYNGMEKARKWWDDWDLRILTLYILISQLYLHFFGRLRRKNKSVLMMLVSVWLLYLFSDLLATIALGKLSKIKVEGSDKGDPKNLGEHALRVMWAPLVLFYLGGPDTITVLRVEENQLWVRHLIGLLTQGLRTAYALIVTWNKQGLSLLALLVFVSGIIKYGERVWVVKTRSKDYKGFVQIELPTIDKISASQPNAEPVLLAYSWFRTLMPHDKGYECNARDVAILVTRFRGSIRTGSFDAFKLIEIELGLIYDILFSKVGTIFTVWGSILRFLSFSLIVSVLVIFIKWEKPHGHLEDDHIITIVLLAGAIFLETAGIVVQLVSDWALVWACKNGSKWTTSVLFLHEILISKSPRWSGVIGQFSLREFCDNYKPTWCDKMSTFLFGRVKMLKRFSSKKSLDQHLKDLIITHLREKLGEAVVVNTLQISRKGVADVNTSKTSTQLIEEVDKLQPSTGKVANVDKFSAGVKRGEWTLERFDLVQQFKWSIELEFGQSIVIWHVATQVCYESDYPKFFGEEVKLKTVKIFSDYMMYLLVVCPDRFPFCIEYVKLMQDYAEMKKVFQGGVVLSRLEEVENEGDTTNIPLVNRAQRLVQDMKGNSKRWDIMRSMWAEMLCYAATKCPVKNHIQELRHGGEFLTHVWLLLLHFGITKKLERSTSSLKDEHDSGVKAMGGSGGEIEGDRKDRLAEKLEENEAEIDLDTGFIQ
ncbi:hypothetical protein Vadar_029763 [Vaccinium darrowii]|uniref:Uncharacterized protein n=1 Tax=Vaccinium darrowii TaxID=229202 RepID=A0ACB7ZF19_9ERIC|nr:hypothetical protein Vadar_029763 [Vaccinium darrowii]